MNKCLIVKGHRFLWWKWNTEYISHSWAYKNEKERTCSVCGEKQIRFDDCYYNGLLHEDWRKKI